MRVLYDGAIYGIQAAGGVNQYLARLIDLGPDYVEPFLSTNVRRTVNYPTNPSLKTFYFKRFCFRPGWLCFWLEQKYFRRVMLGRHYDIFHPSLYAENAAQLPLAAFDCPIVVTVYDMIDELFPEVDSTGLRRRQKEECFRVANALICISKNTRKDLLHRHPELEPKVHVVPVGCEIDISTLHSREGVPSEPYFLYVGGRRSAYKNFPALLEAFHQICSHYPKVWLVIAGAPLTSEETAMIEKGGITRNIVAYQNPDEAQLARLYRWSVALVYPSLYEGFGIPPLEAMTCGTCVIATNRSSLPEVVGDAGLLLDPDDSNALPQALIALLKRPALRAELIARGRERARLFSWQHAVDGTIEVYRRVLSTTCRPGAHDKALRPHRFERV